MATYGIPYQGSKSSIAEDIIAHLPSGNRFIDLFGGGFAISHCALLSYKWKQVVYNDINPLLPKLIQDAIDGKYNYNNFKPSWISRDDFLGLKDTDGYIKTCWSFGNDGETYLYGKDIEEYKHQGHDFCVDGTQIPDLKYLNLENEIDTIKGRRIELNQNCKAELEANPDNPDAKKLQALIKIEHLERLERIQKLENLDRQQCLLMTCMDYHDYKYHDGDVVYCDIPYQNIYENKANDYGQIFDSGSFYNWAISRPYPVYFSSYSLGGIVWETDKQVTLAAQTNNVYRREVLYCVDNDYRTPLRPYQNKLF